MSYKMQAVILAAGKSTRAYPLTLTRPKPLLKAANKTLLEHNLDSLNGLVAEAIIVVGYKKGMIMEHIGKRYRNISIKYVEQKNQLGTGSALLEVKNHIKDDFISLYADDIYSKNDFKNILRYKYSILVRKVKNPSAFGVVIKKNNILADLIEKPKKFVSNLVNTGMYKLNKKIFVITKKLKKSERGEYELTDAIKNLADKEKIYCIMSKDWLPISNAFDLLKADKTLRKNKNFIGKNTRVNGIVKNSSIGDGCIIDGIVKNSMIMNGTIIDENSAVEDSVIGENVHFSGRIISKKQIGAIIGDNCELINVKIMPMVKINPLSKMKNKIVRNDAE